MGDGLTVACVLWVGDFRGRRYSPEWVRKLKSMASRTLPKHRFVCLSNVHVDGVEIIPVVRSPLNGWWAKIGLFSPHVQLGDLCLYLDLDSLLIGGLDGMASHPVSPGQLVTAPPSWRWHGATSGPSGGDGVVDRVQSSAMLWRPGTVCAPWINWTQEVPLRYRGDQDWLGAVQRDHATFPGEWFCKLKHCIGGPPKGVKVVASMPWKNDDAAKRFEWVRGVWC